MSRETNYVSKERAFAHMEQTKANKQQLVQAFQLADLCLNRSYLDHFSSAPLYAANHKVKDITRLRLIEVTKIVLDPEEHYLDKLMSVYSALYSVNSSVAMIISSDGNEIKLYMGTRSDLNPSLAEDILESTLKGNFPGIELTPQNMKQTESVLSSFRGPSIKSLSSVSVIPSVRRENEQAEKFVQGLEKFIDAMSGSSYTMVCLATPLDPATIETRKHGYEEICSALTPHAKLSIAYGMNESTAVNQSISSGFTESVNRSVTNSTSRSSSRSSGTNSSTSSGTSYNGGFSGDGSSFGWGSNSGYSSGSFSSYTSSDSFSNSISDSVGSSTSDTRSSGTTDTKGSSETITINFENKGVENLIERAQTELERFKLAESFGMWEFCSYFLSSDIHTTVLAGNVYKALLTGKESNTETAHVNIWSINQKEQIDSILDYVLHLMHPVTSLPVENKKFTQQIVTPTNLINGNELPLVMSFPKKSVAGLPVIEMAEFGRAVVYENRKPERSIDFGSIYHMGTTEKQRVVMDLDLLSSHCFITGSSGSGKSYATYQLLEQIIENDVQLMVIEPAKGEYKQIFGGLKGIKIYTTDPNSYRLLKINPFQFPENIHVLSHIEQLLQIFNASWSLYAAMPAILKQAVVDSYTRCGWDVQNSIWIPGLSDHKYPVFQDVLDILPIIINTSDYSADSKGDYKGALLTRVQSMTVGMNGEIFKKSCGLEDSLLFDSNVVIDLSELGSEEAIALIMGVLIMKLNEYRKSQRKTNPKMSLNSKLKHVTVLEEAHNLLKRTSKDQNQEGSNIVGKSVEMISNSIKEMRTYGEGFIIIDQSPMAVDTSAIENTATKIIMNTPSKDACEELGSALSLTNSQNRELSRLNVGVAAVFQKGWLSPVLMKIDKWDDRYNTNLQITDLSELRRVKGLIVETLYRQRSEGKFLPMKLRAITRNSALTADKRRELDETVSAYTDRFPAGKPLSNYYFGSLLLDVIGCRSLFTVLPLNGIPTYKQFSKQDPKSPEFQKMSRRFKEQSQEWYKKFLETMPLYISIEDETVRSMAVIDMLYTAGSGGRIKYFENEKLPMLCRMVFKQLGIEIS